MKVFILSIYVTTLSTCELVVDNTVDGKDTKEEKPREVPDIITSHAERLKVCGRLMRPSLYIFRRVKSLEGSEELSLMAAFWAPSTNATDSSSIFHTKYDTEREHIKYR